MQGDVYTTSSESGFRVKARSHIQGWICYVFPLRKEIQVTFRVFVFHPVDNFYMLTVH